ncbi:Armadillo repeat-containing protein 6 like [Pseudolycoriella hygida]|uniref:Armadillo repeat-containing protein 6 like n=1 Tax=Pseudolycoriella hygida TaxID=35572 RepID=A0A9Q0MQQ8_9DIPT|nr:Armadillo repeat-containing protein 6 like [Pseudolycoriella hygida]
MAKVITQETFDDVVKENIVEFEMAVDEAKDETIKQFEAQGINLANIIKDLTLNAETGEPLLNEAINCLKEHTSGKRTLSDESLVVKLDVLLTECSKSVPHRVLASKNGCCEVLKTIINNALKAEPVPLPILLKSLKAFNSVMNKQPDVFDADTLLIVIAILERQTDVAIRCSVLRLIAKACVMHEINRQNIMNADIVTYLKPLLADESSEIVTEVCTVFRYLILDDDIRVEFGKAHEHARSIATEVLTEITTLLTKFKDNPTISCDLILTIAALTVRNEFCVTVEDAGGLDFIIDAMKTFPDNVKLIRESLKLFRALAGNDKVKTSIIQHGAAPIINDVLNRHKENETIAKLALICISTLTLRSIENSKILFEVGVAETIVESMKLHPSSKAVQRNGAWAIRNMVSRSRYQCETFISYGVEDILNEALTTHPSVEHDIKSALRDLGCKLVLKEEWTNTSSYKIERE